MEVLGPGSFDGQTLRRPGRFAVVFTADWCPFCHAFLSQFARLEGTPKLHLARADLTDLESPFWEQFGIEVTPTAIVFREGEVTLRLDGVLGVGLGPADVERIRASASA